MPLNIDQGDVTYDDTTAEYTNTSRSGVITDCMVHNHYEKDGMTYAGGLTSPEPFNGALVGVVRLANPVLILVSEWTTMCLGGEITVPDPTPASSDWVLLDIMPTLTQMTVGPSGKDPVYRASGAYVYVKKNPSASVYDDAVFPKAPWLKDGLHPRYIPAAGLDGSIIAGKAGNTGLGDGGFGPADGKGFKGGGDLGVPKG